jgi:hypothetical protein
VSELSFTVEPGDHATAKTHISRTMPKLGARDRAQLVVLAYPERPCHPRAGTPDVTSTQPGLITYWNDTSTPRDRYVSAQGLTDPAGVRPKYAAAPTTRPSAERSFASPR